MCRQLKPWGAGGKCSPSRTCSTFPVGEPKTFSSSKRPVMGERVPGWCSSRSIMPDYSARKKLDSWQRHPHAMFVVTEEDEAAIRAVYEQQGEFAVACGKTLHRTSQDAPRPRFLYA